MHISLPANIPLKHSKTMTKRRMRNLLMLICFQLCALHSTSLLPDPRSHSILSDTVGTLMSTFEKYCRSGFVPSFKRRVTISEGRKRSTHFSTEATGCINPLQKHQFFPHMVDCAAEIRILGPATTQVPTNNSKCD